MAGSGPSTDELVTAEDTVERMSSSTGWSLEAQDLRRSRDGDEEALVAPLLESEDGDGVGSGGCWAISTNFEAEQDPFAELWSNDCESKSAGKGLSSYIAELRTRLFLLLPVTCLLVPSLESRASQILLGSSTGTGSGAGSGTAFL